MTEPAEDFGIEFTLPTELAPCKLRPTAAVALSTITLKIFSPKLKILHRTLCVQMIEMVNDHTYTCIVFEWEAAAAWCETSKL